MVGVYGWVNYMQFLFSLSCFQMFCNFLQLVYISSSLKILFETKDILMTMTTHALFSHHPESSGSHSWASRVDIQHICPHMVIHIIHCWPASNWLVPWHLGGYIVWLSPGEEFVSPATLFPNRHLPHNVYVISVEKSQVLTLTPILTSWVTLVWLF